ncbi:MAG TPA: protein translocase subunit SecD [Myxococcota bacterium]|nr:protein translocase subunit SecD [Myxococcota bacterium]
MKAFRWQLFGALALVLYFAFLSFANLIPKETRVDSPFLPDEGLRLGLDLQGGIHWVLGVKLAEAEKQELDFLRENLLSVAKDDGFHLDSVKVEDGRLMVAAADSASADKVREWAGRSNSFANVVDEGTRLEYTLTPAAITAVRKRGMEQVLEVLRNRIADPVKGIPDSVVTRQGEDRVLVQIPGGQIDRSRARELLRITGFLEFKIVHDSAPTEELLRAKYPDGLPPDRVIATEREKQTDRVLMAFLLDATPALTGDRLRDARVGFDRQNRPIVEFSFDEEGGRIFGEVTGANIGNQLAIVLDNRVYSAPNIRSRISNRGQIEGRFSPQEAADLAVVLRSGSLPIPVEIEEERTVGPELGADSIASGLNASLLGFALVVTFCMIYYRLSGVYASLALIGNMFLLLGLMSLFGATLTLPGIAGIVLTLGMAVDANVLIFERIREELRAQKAPRGAIRAGFDKAFRTIMDSNITTLITALVLYEYGTGPIKGFAVTFSLGILTSVFAALVLTRLLFGIYPGDRPVHSLSI